MLLRLKRLSSTAPLISNNQVRAQEWKLRNNTAKSIQLIKEGKLSQGIDLIKTQPEPSVPLSHFFKLMRTTDKTSDALLVFTQDHDKSWFKLNAMGYKCLFYMVRNHLNSLDPRDVTVRRFYLNLALKTFEKIQEPDLSLLNTMLQICQSTINMGGWEAAQELFKIQEHLPLLASTSNLVAYNNVNLMLHMAGSASGHGRVDAASYGHSLWSRLAPENLPTSALLSYLVTNYIRICTHSFAPEDRLLGLAVIQHFYGLSSSISKDLLLILTPHVSATLIKYALAIKDRSAAEFWLRVSTANGVTPDVGLEKQIIELYRSNRLFESAWFLSKNLPYKERVRSRLRICLDASLQEKFELTVQPPEGVAISFPVSLSTAQNTIFRNNTEIAPYLQVSELPPLVLSSDRFMNKHWLWKTYHILRETRSHDVFSLYPALLGILYCHQTFPLLISVLQRNNQEFISTSIERLNDAVAFYSLPQSETDTPSKLLVELPESLLCRLQTLEMCLAAVNAILEDKVLIPWKLLYALDKHGKATDKANNLDRPNPMNGLNNDELLKSAASDLKPRLEDAIRLGSHFSSFLKIVEK